MEAIIHLEQLRNFHFLTESKGGKIKVSFYLFLMIQRNKNDSNLTLTNVNYYN